MRIFVVISGSILLAMLAFAAYLCLTPIPAALSNLDAGRPPPPAAPSKQSAQVDHPSDASRSTPVTSDVTQTPVTASLAPQVPAEPAHTPPPTPRRELLPMPLVFFEADVDMALTNEQQSALDDLRRQFTQEVGGAYQNPYDPRYAERWQQAQPEIEERTRFIVGSEVYLRFQHKAVQAESN